VPLFRCEQNRAGSAAGALPPCVGDCDGDDRVALSELVTGVNVALGTLDLGACPGLNGGAAAVTIDALVGAVAANLQGCVPVAPQLNEDGLAVIDTERNRVFVVIPFGRAGPGRQTGAVQPRGSVGQVNGTGIDLTPDGRFAYVAGCDIPNLVCVIDTRSNTLSTRFAAFDVGQFAFDIAITPDGRLAYVTQSTRSQVSVIDLRTNSITGALFVPENRGVAAGRRIP
jgi:DNA-binding beta-propeller fold protein YncE